MIEKYDDFKISNRILKLKCSSDQHNEIRLPFGIHIHPKKHRILIKKTLKKTIWYAIAKNSTNLSGAIQIYPEFCSEHTLKLDNKTHILKFWQVVTDKDRYDCQLLVSKLHYLMGPNRGAILACGIKRDTDVELIGCAFLDKMTYTAPLTNRSCFLKKSIHDLKDYTRGQIVNNFCISWVSRFVVESDYRSCGIGRLLAKNIATMAARHFSPVSSYIEVYTTESTDKVKLYSEEKKLENNFLISAGYTLKPDFNKYAKVVNGYDQEGFKSTTTGRKLYYYRDIRPLQDRLFLPLSSEPFSWFLSRKKKWEIRNISSQYNLSTVYTGRRVEARYGYKADKAPLWGTINEVRCFSSLKDLLQEIKLEEMLPNVTKKEEAKRVLAAYINIDTNGLCNLIAFKINLDD